MRRRSILGVLALATVLGTVAVPVGAQQSASLSILVTDVRGAPVSSATVAVHGRSAVTDGFGRALIRDVAPGPVEVGHARFTERIVDWRGRGDRLRVVLTAPVLRALHFTGALPGTARWGELLGLADRTALNAVMLDMKDESGVVWPNWSGSAPAPAAAGRWNLRGVADELHGRGLALIVRIVAFQDPRFAVASPASAVYNASTGGPFTRKGQVFLDPSDTVARRYVRELVVAACAAGADEVQLDYIRFPDGITPKLRFDDVDPASSAARSATITGFIEELRRQVGDCVLGADVFGFVTSITGDGGIGQDLVAMARATDVVSPMVYPNHWSAGWFGYLSPAANPGGVVTASMSNALARAGSLATMRPWLQDFGSYGPVEVRAQIDAADRLGLGWMIWNARSEFHSSALPTDAEVRTPAAPPPPVEEVLPVSGFWDVADGSTFSLDVAWMGNQGITRGCNPPWRDEYCPRRGVTRAEAAAFLVRALSLAPTTTDRFVDDSGSTHEADINALAAAGITRGCSPTTFCPNQVLTRAQMASLLARALALPGVDTDPFVDDDRSSHEHDIERIAAVGITFGCGPARFCPTDPVTREQLAAFLHRALQ